MKKVINGKVYDTDTAQKAGHWNNKCYDSDFDFYSETLYHKRTGEFFLLTSSFYDRDVFVPLSLAGAQEWAEKRLDGDDYIAIFGDPGEGDGTRVALNLTVPAETKATLERMRAETGKSISQLVTDLVSGV